MVKNSTDEVRVVIKDSRKRNRKYWNLRDSKVTNGRKEKEAQTNSGENNGESNKVEVKFRLDQTRELSESQKQTILATLSEPKYQEETLEEQIQNRANKSRWFNSYRLGFLNFIGILILLLFLILVLLGLTGGSCLMS